MNQPSFRRTLAGIGFCALLAGCSDGMLQSTPDHQYGGAVHPAVSQYVYVADRTQEELLVYPAGVQNPSPIRTIKQGLTQIGGVAVDSAGDAYVANAQATGGTGVPSVLEFSRGGTSLIQIFSQTLHHPVNVALDSNGDVYVADENGKNSQLVEFGPSGGAPIKSFPTPSNALPRGVVVDSAGDLFVSISGIGDFWPPPAGGDCLAVDGVYEYPAGSMTPHHIGTGGEQEWGLALDSAANLYESDYCLNHIWTFTPPNYYAPGGSLAGTYNEPIYITISSDKLLAIPNANNGSGGYVTVEDITGAQRPVTITNGLQGPIGATAGR